MREKKLLIDLTRRCNLKCPWCSMKYGDMDSDPQSVMSAAVLESLISEIKETPFQQYGLRGGEPLLYPGLLRTIVERIKGVQPDALFFLLTNGTLLDRDIVDYVNMHNIPVAISINASGYKGLENFILKTPLAENIVQIIRSLKQHSIRLVLQRRENFSAGAILMHNIFPRAEIEVGFDFFQLQDWTKEDIDFLCSELKTIKQLAPGFATWFKVMQGFKRSCSCADIARFYPDSQKIESGVFDKKNCIEGCAFFESEMGGMLYRKYQDLCEEFGIGRP